MSGLPRRPSAIAAVLAVALGACATGRLKPGFRPEGEVVDAEGWTPLGSDDLLALKRRSLLEAQKKAVEQVVGVFISGKTRVSQAAEVDENILGKVEGFVRRYEVLSEKREDGFYKTRV
ncbi:MAG TPA: hypothetical protein VNI01_07905, partial [Elusimicrobiota bacterium]|nr:hypothetical protein [Elusimicrobiota bacterium]